MPAQRGRLSALPRPQVQSLVSRCTCPVQFSMVKVSEGKYQVGDSNTVIFIRVSPPWGQRGCQAIFPWGLKASTEATRSRGLSWPPENSRRHVATLVILSALQPYPFLEAPLSYPTHAQVQ